MTHKEAAELRRQKVDLEQQRLKIKQECEQHRSTYTTEQLDGKAAELRSISDQLDGINIQLKEAPEEREVYIMPENKLDLNTENYRSSDKYKEAFFRSLVNKRVSEADADVMAFGKRAITDMNGGSVTSGANYLVPLNTLNLIEGAIKEYGQLFSYVGGYNFTGDVSIPIGDTTYTENEDGTTSLHVTFSDVKFTQEAIVVTAELKNLLLKNSIAALESYVATELAMVIAEKGDHAILMGDNGSFEGIVPAITPTPYSKLDYATLTGLFGKLKGKISRRSAFAMNESTFWAEIASNVDSAGQPIQIGGQVFWSYDANGNAKIMGKPVIFTDAVGDGDVVFGDFKNRYKKNTSLDISLESDVSQKFSEDKTMVRLKIYSGGKPIRAAESFIFLVKSTDIVATPTANPAAGAVASGTAITLATATTGATIYYTKDGSAPTRSSTKYSSTAKPTITEATTIKAFAVKAGMADSAVLTAAYTLS